MKMNKKQLIQTIATKTGYTQKVSSEVMNAFWDTVEDVLTNNGSISLVGYCSISTKLRASRRTRNLRTGQMMTIPSKTVPVIKLGKKLKLAANN